MFFENFENIVFIFFRLFFPPLCIYFLYMFFLSILFFISLFVWSPSSMIYILFFKYFKSTVFFYILQTLFFPLLCISFLYMFFPLITLFLWSLSIMINFSVLLLWVPDKGCSLFFFLFVCILLSPLFGTRPNTVPGLCSIQLHALITAHKTTVPLTRCTFS